MAEAITDANFVEKTIDGLCLVDFWAPWCGPCRMQGPIIDELASELTDVHVYKLNIDENPDTTQRLGVRSIPTMFLMRDGEIVETIVGLHTKEQLLEVINSYR